VKKKMSTEVHASDGFLAEDNVRTNPLIKENGFDKSGHYARNRLLTLWIDPRLSFLCLSIDRKKKKENDQLTKK